MRCINCREKFEKAFSKKHCSNCKTAEREYQSEKMTKTESQNPKLLLKFPEKEK
jgi:hypothetical protein